MRRPSANTAVAGAIVAIWVLWLVGVVLHGNGVNILTPLGVSSSYKRAAEFGDAFGPLSSLMAALAAVGAWFAFKQSQEQAFESTFYSLLAHHNSIVASVDILQKKREKLPDESTELKTGDNYQGRDAFRRMLRLLRSTIAGMKNVDELARVSEGYKRFHERYEDELAHYFRTIYYIVLFIHRSKIKDKDLYIKILRAQLSNSEQILLLYNVSVGFGYWKFKELVENYSRAVFDRSESAWDSLWSRFLIQNPCW